MELDRYAKDRVPDDGSDYSILREEGCNVPSGRIARTAEWTFLPSGTERLTDMLATDIFIGQCALVPADTSIVNGDLAMAITRQLARTAIARGRIQAHEWEAYADELSEACKPAPRWEAGSYQASRYNDSIESLRKPSPSQVIAASVDPQFRHSWSRRLEWHGSKILRAAHLPIDVPDVLPKHKPRLICKADRVAYKGEPRYVLPQPCQYGQYGLQPAALLRDEPKHRVGFIGSSDGIVEADLHPVVERLTTITRPSTDHTPITVYSYDNDTSSELGPLERGRLIGRRTEWITFDLRDTRERQGWRGHRRIEWSLAPLSSGPSVKRDAEREVVRIERETVTTSTRGPAVGPWTLSDRSLNRSAEKVAEAVAVIEAVLRSAEVGSVVQFRTGELVTVVGKATVHDEERGRTYPIRAWSRRAALDGATL